MEFCIENVHFRADEWEVTTEIANQVLHVCPGLFVTGPRERLPNFKVQLNKRLECGIQNNGTGKFTLTKTLGRNFQRFNDQNLISVEVRRRKLKFTPTRNPIEKSLLLELEKAPFIDPCIARDRTQRINALCDPFDITYVQIGLLTRPVQTAVDDDDLTVGYQVPSTYRKVLALKTPAHSPLNGIKILAFGAGGYFSLSMSTSPFECK